jgi:sugar/nucleoside kinase (ribokinase family)
MFAGAFIYAMQKGYRAEHAAVLANHAAAKIVTQHGTRLHQDQMNRVVADWRSHVG